MTFVFPILFVLLISFNEQLITTSTRRSFYDYHMHLHMKSISSETFVAHISHLRSLFPSSLCNACVIEAFTLSVRPTSESRRDFYDLHRAQAVWPSELFSRLEQQKQQLNIGEKSNHDEEKKYRIKIYIKFQFNNNLH